MKADYRFWETLVNPVTGRVTDDFRKLKTMGEGEQQLRDERVVASLARTRISSRIKKVSKFW